MDFLLLIFKDILLIPVWALILLPFLRWSIKLNKQPEISFSAAFILGLLTGASSLCVSLILYPFYNLMESLGIINILWIAIFGVNIWLYGHFIRGESGKSVGLFCGFKIFSLMMIQMLSFVFIVALIVVSF